MAKKKKQQAQGAVPVLMFAAALLVALGLGLGMRYFLTPSGDAGQVTIGGPFTLTDDNGERVSDKTYQGKYMLVYFGYTFCPDVCPTSLGTIVDALGRVPPEKAAKIQPIMITVDPERDTLERLHEFVQAFHPDLIGLTGSEEEIAQIAKAYRVYYAKVKTEDPTIGYLIDHSAQTYLMGPDGAFLRHFSHNVDPADMAKAFEESVQ